VKPQRDQIPESTDEKPSKVEPRPEPVEAKDDGALRPPDDRVLGEISHEMGNYFHKLYYWTDYLRGETLDRSQADAAAVEMLSNTVEKLEQFMRMTLEYFSPARLSFNRVTVSDVVEGLGSRLSGRTLKIENLDAYAEIPVLADPSLIGHAIRTVFERVASTLLDEAHMTIRLNETRSGDFRGIEVEFEAGGGARGVQLRSGIEMAVAEKFLHMHGAELLEREETSPTGAERRSLVVFLPIYT
jgi:hypothetical protein